MRWDIARAKCKDAVVGETEDEDEEEKGDNRGESVHGGPENAELNLIFLRTAALLCTL